MDDKFSVYQFFEDKSYEKVREDVPILDAFDSAIHYSESVAAKLGLVARVIITDADDFCVFEWKKNEGIVFPVLDAGNMHYGQAGKGKTANLCSMVDRFKEDLCSDDDTQCNFCTVHVSESTIVFDSGGEGDSL